MATLLSTEVRNNHESSKSILELLRLYLSKHPEIRLWQALLNLGIVEYIDENNKELGIIDDYYLSNTELLKKVRNMFEIMY